MIPIQEKKILPLFLLLFLLAVFLLLYYFISRNTANQESSQYIDIQQAYTQMKHEKLPSVPALETATSEPKTPQLPTVLPDFDGLRELNEETIGWIHIPDTPISYPVMQTTDNSKYLERDSAGRKSNAGAVFMDAQNSLSPLDQNTILYGHNMGDGRENEMFGPLLLYKEKTFRDAHPYIQFDTHLEAHGWWEVFAVLHLDLRDTGFNYLNQSFPNNADFEAWLKNAKERALYETGVVVTMTDRVLTLSTCDRSQFRSNGRLVVMAVHRGEINQ